MIIKPQLFNFYPLQLYRLPAFKHQHARAVRAVKEHVCPHARTDACCNRCPRNWSDLVSDLHDLKKLTLFTRLVSKMNRTVSITCKRWPTRFVWPRKFSEINTNTDDNTRFTVFVSIYTTVLHALSSVFVHDFYRKRKRIDNINVTFSLDCLKTPRSRVVSNIEICYE